MPDTSTKAPHHRWRLSVPEAQEENLSDWLMEEGATAFYREADPPRAFYAYFPPGLDLPDPDSLVRFPGVHLEEAESFQDEDWLAKSREGFGPIEVGQRFYIRPHWDESPVPGNRIPLIVNPGLAFGTGGHETTRLCMELLEKLAYEGRWKGPVLDIGSGTGILSLAAHLLGAEDIWAFDLDPDCGPAMDEFIEMNQAVLRHAQPFHPLVGTIEEDRIQAHRPYGGLLANILLETIQELLPAMAKLTETGSWLIASGILSEREEEALISLAAGGFRPREVCKEGEWIAILAERT